MYYHCIHHPITRGVAGAQHWWWLTVREYSRVCTCADIVISNYSRWQIWNKNKKYSVTDSSFFCFSTAVAIVSSLIFHPLRSAVYDFNIFSRRPPWNACYNRSLWSVLRRIIRPLPCSVPWHDVVSRGNVSVHSNLVRYYNNTSSTWSFFRFTPAIFLFI